MIIVAVLVANLAHGQSEEQKLATTMQQFHQALIQKDTMRIREQTDPALSYGHSNGWIESQDDLIKNLSTGYMNYHRFKEDSLTGAMNKDVAWFRFVADISVAMNGKDGSYHLKVLEVWVKKGKRWLLFARQAVKG